MNFFTSIFGSEHQAKNWIERAVLLPLSDQQLLTKSPQQLADFCYKKMENAKKHRRNSDPFAIPPIPPIPPKSPRRNTFFDISFSIVDKMQAQKATNALKQQIALSFATVQQAAKKVRKKHKSLLRENRNLKKAYKQELVAYKSELAAYCQTYARWEIGRASCRERV